MSLLMTRALATKAFDSSKLERYLLLLKDQFLNIFLYY